MPRAPETPGMPARNRVQVLLNDDDYAALDSQRGTTSASSYARTLLRHGLANHATKAVAGTQAPDGHTHAPGDLLAHYTVNRRTTKIYRCTGCTKEVTT